MATEREIEELIRTALGSLREMVDVNTIVGEAITGAGGVTVIPVSKVCCGFIAGGGDLCGRRNEQPFMGGSGAGLHLQPVCFLVMSGDSVHLLPICDAGPADRLVDSIPSLTEKVCRIIAGKSEN